MPQNWNSVEGKADARNRTNLVKFLEKNNNSLDDSGCSVDISKVNDTEIVDLSAIDCTNFYISTKTDGGGGGTSLKFIEGTAPNAQDYMLVKFKLTDLFPDLFADDTGVFVSDDGHPESFMIRNGSTFPFSISQDYEETDTQAPISDGAAQAGEFVSQLHTISAIVSGNAISIIIPDANGYVSAYVDASTMEMNFTNQIRYTTQTFEDNEWLWSFSSTYRRSETQCVETDLVAVTLDVSQGAPSSESPQNITPVADNPQAQAVTSVTDAPTSASAPVKTSGTLSNTADTTMPYACVIVILCSIALLVLVRKTR